MPRNDEVEITRIVEIRPSNSRDFEFVRTKNKIPKIAEKALIIMPDIRAFCS